MCRGVMGKVNKKTGTRKEGRARGLPLRFCDGRRRQSSKEAFSETSQKEMTRSRAWSCTHQAEQPALLIAVLVSMCLLGHVFACSFLL